MARWLDPVFLARHGDLALLALRLFLGAFLVWGVWDNIVSPARMAEFEAFLRQLNCPCPAVAAPLSVWAQFLVGLGLAAGLLTRWAGLILSVNFIVATVLLGGAGAAIRELYPPAVLVFIGLVFATHGPGRWALDPWLAARLTRRGPVPT